MHENIKFLDEILEPMQSPVLVDTEQKERLKTITNVGTINYMSPERLNVERYSFPSDIWSLGLVIYEMVIGHNPYPLTD